MSNDESYPHQPPRPPSRRRSLVALVVTSALVLFTGGGAIGYAVGKADSDDLAATPVDTVDSSSVADEPTAVETVETPMHTPEPEPTSKAARDLDKATLPELSDRGLVIKDVGEPAYLGPSHNVADAMVEFTVDKIEVDPACTGEWAEDKPENGHFVVATLSATVKPGFTEWAEEDGYFATGMSFNPHEFGLIDADGIVVNEPVTTATYSCLDEGETMPSEVTDGQTATGKVVLDSPSATGVLTLQPSFNPGGGWEWTF